jgi:hypothetical protein
MKSKKILPDPPFPKEGIGTSPFEKGGLRGILRREDKSFLALLYKRRELEPPPLTGGASRQGAQSCPVHSLTGRPAKRRKVAKRGIKGDFKKRGQILPCPPLQKEGVEKKAGDLKQGRS